MDIYTLTDKGGRVLFPQLALTRAQLIERRARLKAQGLGYKLVRWTESDDLAAAPRPPEVLPEVEVFGLDETPNPPWEDVDIDLSDIATSVDFEESL